MKKNLILSITLTAVGLASGAGILWATGTLSFASSPAKSAMTASAPPLAPVTVAAALERSITEWNEFSGRIEAVDRVEIRPQVSGILETVHFEEGQIVNKGDLLFTIDPRPFQADLARAQAALAGAQAKLVLDQNNLSRNRQLLQAHAISQSDLDQSNDALLEADASVKAALAAVQTAQINLDYTAIRSPVTGRVSRAEITEGNLVATGASAPILTTVVSVNPVYVEFEVDEQTFLKYASNGAAGNSGLAHIPVSMGLSSEDDYPHQGHLKSIDNRLDITSGTIRVRAVFANESGQLTPGLYAKVRIGETPAPTILVDDRAVGTDQDKKYVMVVGANNIANYRAVTLGPMADGLRVIHSGLQKDERIVVNGLQRVRPNAPVIPEEVAMDRTHAGPELTAASAK